MYILIVLLQFLADEILINVLSSCSVLLLVMALNQLGLSSVVT